ncbi:hypothetical protein ACTQ1D_01570 [Parafannyhessea umbonata]|uniref:hypothetical protein n=1 Tax=Parafannyhessea umbonata TaxID=604330 RepID=UPI003F96B9C1
MTIGHTVRVWSRSRTGTDDMGEPTYSWSHADVGNVLVRPLSAASADGSDAAAGMRPDGVVASFRLAFPKAYGGPPLRGCRVCLTDAPWSMDPGTDSPPPDALLVSGEPAREDPCPTLWDTVAEVGRMDG